MGLRSHQVSYLPPLPHTMPRAERVNPSGKLSPSTSNQYCSTAAVRLVCRKMPRSRVARLPVSSPHRMTAVAKLASSDEDSWLFPSGNSEGPLAQECPA